MSGWETVDDEEDVETNDGAGATAEQLGAKYASAQLRIVRTTMDFTLHNLKQIIGDHIYLNLMPEYQRRNRWDNKQRSRLIESLLMNIPVPPVFLYERDYNGYEVMDGLQRLSAIQDFLDNKFRLSSLEFWSELHRKRFSDLPDVLQKGLLRRTLSAVVLLAESSRPDDPSGVDVRMVLFRRLNTGGIALNPQELRNALYPGSLNDLLLELSCNPVFTRVWDIPHHSPGDEPTDSLRRDTRYRKMTDCELVLRFFAVRDTILTDQRGSLQGILDRYMVNHKTEPLSSIDSLRTTYLRSLVELDALFGGKPFVLPPRTNPSEPLYDALMVAHSLLTPREYDPEAIQLRLKDAAADDHRYAVLTGKPNTLSAIKERVSLASEILTGQPDE